MLKILIVHEDHYQSRSMEVHFKQGKTEGPEEGRKIKTRS